ncbi:MAG: hypothetical protein HYX83_03200 [Chloroflexi bacterium]|nr:hypothetical protein [Chloroflexota bacterium]
MTQGDAIQEYKCPECDFEFTLRRSLSQAKEAACPLCGASLPSMLAPPMPVQGKEIKVEGGAYYDVTPPQLVEMLRNKDFLLVNVYPPYPGELPETDLVASYNAIESSLENFPKDKNARIVVYCGVGYASAIAAKTLVKLGFSNVWNLEGGTVAWEQAGFELLGK